MRTINLLYLTLGVSLSTIMPAFAQAPTPAQQQAIRSNCVSDYRANCSGVPTGGMDALICLEQHSDKLSPACKSAVEAVEPASAPATEAAAAPAEAASAPAKPADTDEASAPAETSADTATKPDEADKASAPAPAAAAAKPPASEPRLTFRQEMRIAGGSCAIDFRLLCPNLPIGHGNVLFCLQVHWPRLAPACQEALTAIGAAP
jgi:hypothetical protein